MTGKDSYSAMLKNVVSPGLRALGFTGSSGRYSLPTPTHWAQVGFQKSAYGSSDEVRFTFNISVVSKDVWNQHRAEEPALADKPAPTLLYGPADRFLWVRIGTLANIEKSWWDVNATTDINALGAEMVRLVADFALPAIIEHINAPERP